MCRTILGLLKGKSRGNALVMVAIVLFVAATMATQVLYYTSSRSSIQRNQLLMERIGRINNAISLFVGTNNRLPCPASPNLLITDANFGLESRDSNYQCNSSGIISNTTAGSIKYMGAVPYKTLGLSAQDVVDVWGNKIEYVVGAYLYINSTENGSNNYYSTAGILNIGDALGNVISSSNAYILISRGPDQLAGWPANGTNRIQIPAAGSLELENTECAVANAACSSSNFNNLFVAGDMNTVDDIIFYRSTSTINSDCKSDTNNTSCNKMPCASQGSGSSWTNAGNNGQLTITSSNLPTLQLTSNATPQRYYFNFTLLAKDTPGKSVNLMYNYTTTASSTVQTGQVLSFLKKNTSGQFDDSYVGQTLSVPFGGGTQLPQSLFFQLSGPGGSAVSVTISNVSVTTAPLSGQGVLNYNLWTNIGCTNCQFSQLFASSSYPNSPDIATTLTDSVGYTSYGNNYFSMIQGYFTPDQTATYRFYIAADKIANLYFSPNSTPGSAVLVAQRTTASTAQNWAASGATTYSMSLRSGQSYYFHLLQAAGTSGLDNSALGCSKTDSSGTTGITTLALGTDTVGCGGTISNAPMQQILTQPQCQ